MITKMFKSSTKFKTNTSLGLMALPGILWLFFFCYLPMIGIVIAFKQFEFSQGIFGSEWQQPIYNNFKFLFTSESMFRATFNTLFLNGMFIGFGTIVAIMLALILNEVRDGFFKRVAQSFTFLPYFMSWIVVSVFVYSFLSTNSGIVNSLISSLGFERINWYASPKYWPVIFVLIYLWKICGYSSIIYLAALSGIDPNYYEATEIDGANKLQQIIYITLPLLVPTIMIMLLLAVGRIMFADFGMFYGIVGDNSLLLPTTDVLDTFVFRNLRKMGDIGMSSAAALYQATVSCILIILSNKIVKKLDEGVAIF